MSGHEETINNYLKLGLSASAVAKLVKVHPETIRRYARSVPQTSSPAVLPLPTFEPTQKTATIRLRLEVENNSSFVRGRKRARQDIENFHLAQYEMQKLSDDEYELVIPYDDDADLDEQVHQLLSDISIEADNRHCFIDADVREKGTERSW